MGKRGNRTGKSGPAKTSKELLLLRGGKGGANLRDDLLKLCPGAPDMPEDLIGTEAGEEWSRIVRELEPQKALCKIDRAGLYILSIQWALFVDAKNAVRDEGAYYTGPKGRKFLNPAVGIMRDAHKAWLALSSEFGLSPGSRSRLRIPAPAPATDPRAEKFFPHLRKKK